MKAASIRSLALASSFLLVPLASGAVLLSTDFAGRSVDGKTANDILWSSNGLTAPSSMTWVQEGGGPANTNLFDTADAQGHFAPDMNIGNEGPWSTTVSLSLTTLQVALDSIDIDWQHFNNGGALQGVNREVRWTVTVTGSLSGLLANGTAVDSANAMFGLNTLTFGSPLTLNNSETYDVKFLVDNNGNTIGNNTGFDGLSFNGTVIPEPSTVALLGLGGLLLMRRRRA